MNYNFSMGAYPHEQDYLFGGWENLTIDFSFDFYVYEYSHDNQFYGYGSTSVWPTSEYEFTLYYRFVPVIPIE